MRRIVAVAVLLAAVLGSIALVSQAPTLAADTLTRGKDESCWDPQPGKGKSKGMSCDPPYCEPCFEPACIAGKCKWACVPIPGCTPSATQKSADEADPGRVRSLRVSPRRRS